MERFIEFELQWMTIFHDTSPHFCAVYNVMVYPMLSADSHF